MRQGTRSTTDPSRRIIGRFTLPTEDQLVDSGIYTLAIGAFYVTYQTLFELAKRVGMPEDIAAVVAALADLAIILFSRKAVREVRAGRSAIAIRLIVALFSTATAFLQIKAAWPNPTSVTFHALAPAVWIIGHEIMLRGQLRDAKEAKRAAEIASGRRPAPINKIRFTQWLLAPRRTAQVKKAMILSGQDQAAATALLVQRWQHTRPGKPVPAPWQYALTTTPAPPADIRIPLVVVADLTPFKQDAPTPAPVARPAALPRPPQQTATLPNITTTIYTAAPGRQEAAPEVRRRFLASLPPAPAKGRSAEESLAYIEEVEQTAATQGIRATGNLLAELLGVDPSYISQLRRTNRHLTAVGN